MFGIVPSLDDPASAEDQIRARGAQRLLKPRLNQTTMALDGALPKSRYVFRDDRLFEYADGVGLIMKPNASWFVFKMEV